VSDFGVTGADAFFRLSKALKEAGKAELRKELNKGMREASKPLIRQARAAALRELPHRGGLAQRIAKAPMRAQVRTGAETAGVRIVTTSHDTAATDSGRLRHPVYGHKDRYVEQQVTPGWFSQTLSNGAPAVRPELEKAIQSVIDKVIRGG